MDLSSVHIAIIAKRPEPGRVKTRLARSTGPALAARFAEAFLFDTIDRLLGFASDAGSPPTIWVFGDRDRREEFGSLPGAIEYASQGSGHLGDRMATAVAHLAQAGARRVVLLGADTPHLDLDAVRSAAVADRMVVGPATDGGFFLLAASPDANREALGELLREPRWGDDRVLDRARAAVGRAGVRFEEVPAIGDLDAWDDLERWLGPLEDRGPQICGSPTSDVRPNPPVSSGEAATPDPGPRRTLALWREARERGRGFGETHSGCRGKQSIQ